jgi:hypothetical protein
VSHRATFAVTTTSGQQRPSRDYHLRPPRHHRIKAARKSRGPGNKTAHNRGGIEDKSASPYGSTGTKDLALDLFRHGRTARTATNHKAARPPPGCMGTACCLPSPDPPSPQERVDRCAATQRRH